MSALFPSLGKRLSNRKSKSQRRLAAVEDSLLPPPPPLPLPSGGWTFSLLPTSLQEDKDDEDATMDDGRSEDAIGTTESLGKRILFQPDSIERKIDQQSRRSHSMAHARTLFLDTLPDFFRPFFLIEKKKMVVCSFAGLLAIVC